MKGVMTHHITVRQDVENRAIRIEGRLRQAVGDPAGWNPHIDQATARFEERCVPVLRLEEAGLIGGLTWVTSKERRQGIPLTGEEE